MRNLNALTLKQLRALRAVAETRSISRAADTLGLTPPAVHSQLKALDDNFCGAMLYREGPDAFTPTPEGAELLDAFEKIEAGLAMAVHRIDALRKGLAGTVVLGVVSTAKYFAPGIVAALKAALPEVEVVLKVGNRTETIDALKHRALDLVIMGRPPRDPPVTAVPLGDNPHVLIAPPDHPLAQRSDLSPEDILAQPFISREVGSGTRVLAERFLSNLAEGVPAAMIEMSSNETIKRSVIAGLGIALISQQTVIDELKSGRLVTLTLPGLPIVRKWFLLHPSDRIPHGASETVRDFIMANSDRLLPKL